MFNYASKRFPWIPQLILTIFAVFFSLPLIIMFLVSFQGRGFDNYLAVLSLPELPRFFVNSVVVSAGTIAIVFFVSMLAGFAFSKLELKGKQWLFTLIIVGLMLPSTALVVPLFTAVKTARLFDNYLALILPYSAFALPFTLLLVRNFMDGLPDELIEAARIDGASTWTIFIRIVLPLSKAISIVVIIWTFLTAWNEYFLALVFMRSDEMRTITQTPQFFIGVYGQDVGKVFASLVIISIPVVVTYLGLQRYVQDGMVSGSIK